MPGLLGKRLRKQVARGKGAMWGTRLVLLARSASLRLLSRLVPPNCLSACQTAEVFPSKQTARQYCKWNTSRLGTTNPKIMDMLTG